MCNKFQNTAAKKSRANKENQVVEGSSGHNIDNEESNVNLPVAKKTKLTSQGGKKIRLRMSFFSL